MRHFCCVLLAVCAISLCLIGCGDDSSNPVSFTSPVFKSTPRIRYFQAAPVANALQAHIAISQGNSGRTPPQLFDPPALSFGSVSTGFPDLDRGRGNLRITDSSTANLLTLDNIQIDRNKDYLLLTTGEITSDPNTATFRALLLTSDKMKNPPFNTADIRFVHAAPGATDMDVYLLRPGDDINKANPVFAGLTYAGYTQYRTRTPTALYRILFTEKGKKDLLTVVYKPAPQQPVASASNAIALQDSTRYTAILAGRAGSMQYPLQLIFITDMEASTVSSQSTPATP